jgi:hypothetical protein
MAKQKYDGVLEAVHYTPDGQLEWVRVYERRYSAFTDRVLLSRADFIEKLKAGKRFVVGQRILNYGGKFTTGQPVELLQKNGDAVIAVGTTSAKTDTLTGVPIL